MPSPDFLSRAPPRTMLHLVGRQAAGRAVQHEEIAIDDERAGDRDKRSQSGLASRPSARVDQSRLSM